jgi:hypothetical protein
MELTVQLHALATLSPRSQLDRRLGGLPGRAGGCGTLPVIEPPPFSPYSVAIQTELSGPLVLTRVRIQNHRRVVLISHFNKLHEAESFLRS